MPLNAKVSAEIDRQVTSGTMTAEYGAQMKDYMKDAPDSFQSAFLAGPDYQRQSQALAKEKEQVQQWKDWEKTARPAFEEAQNKLTQYETEMAALKAQIATGGGDMTQHQVDIKKELETLKTSLLNDMKGAGYITATQHQEALEKAKLEAIGWMGGYQDQQRRVHNEFRTTFGKDMSPDDDAALVTFANEEAAKQGRNIPLNEAYKMKYGSEIDKVKESNLRATIEKEFETKYGLPGGGGGGGQGTGSATALGPLQQRLKETAGKDFTQGGDGDLQSAKAAAVNALRGL